MMSQCRDTDEVVTSTLDNENPQKGSPGGACLVQHSSIVIIT